MARSRKSKDKPETPTDAVAEEQVVPEEKLEAASEEPPAETPPDEEGPVEPDQAGEETAAEVAETAEASDAEIAADAPEAEILAEAVSGEPAETAEERPAAPVLAAPPPPPPSPSGLAGAALLVAGGVAAALIGFFAARYLDERAAQQATGPTPAENATALADQSARLDALKSMLDELAARDVGPEIAASVDPLRADLDSALADTTTRLDKIAGDLSGLTDQVETLAMRPVATGISPDAFDDALKAFRADLDKAISEANKAVADAQAEITEARATAKQISDEAFKSEQASIARAAWSQVAAAIDAGTPYAEPLAEAEAALSGPVPDVVAQNAEKGVPSLAALQDSFPDAARKALDASIRADTGDGTFDKIAAFVRVQSGARSLTPQEGDDPDAVLSRAEAALQAGDLDATLAELAALPDAGQTAMAGWRDAAETRVAALQAARDLAQQVETE